MKLIVKILLIYLVFVSCKKDIKPEELNMLNGYWEIEKVVLAKEKNKVYSINESYDFFHIDKNNEGFRKKVMPQLDGTFLVNDSQESIKVRFQDDKAFIDYITPYAKWSEELSILSEKELVLINIERNEYHYKKAEPITVLNDGKKTK